MPLTTSIPYLSSERRSRLQKFWFTGKKESGLPQKTSSRTDRLLVWLVRADSTPSSKEMARVVYRSVLPSTFWRRLLELNFWWRGLMLLNCSPRQSCAMRHCHWWHQYRRVDGSDDDSVRLRYCDGNVISLHDASWLALLDLMLLSGFQRRRHTTNYRIFSIIIRGLYLRTDSIRGWVQVLFSHFLW